jgi:hypothetical protein
MNGERPGAAAFTAVHELSNLEACWQETGAAEFRLGQCARTSPNLLWRGKRLAVAGSGRRRSAWFPDPRAAVLAAPPFLDEAVDDTQTFTVGVVNADEGLPPPGQRVLGEDGFDGTLGLAGCAVDALLRVDDEDAVRFVDTVDRAHI